MEFDRTHNRTAEHLDESISIREIVDRYSEYFKWFLLSVIICLVLAFIKLRYETPKYKVNATILIKENEQGNSFADLSEFQDLGLFGSGDNSLENEMQIIKSRKLIKKVVEELKINMSYFIEDSPLNLEKYPDYPVVLHVISKPETVNNISSRFYVEIKSKEKFEFFDFNNNSLGVKSFGEEFKANLGNDEIDDERTISIERNQSYKEDLTDQRIKVVLKPINATVNAYLAKVNIEPVNERFSKVILLSMEESNVAKGVAFLNNLIEQYNADGINDKNEIAKATTDFLDDRLVLIANELEAIENTAAQFKSNRGMINTGAGADIYLESSSRTESEMVTANTQLQLVNYMLDELGNSNLGDLLPGNIGLSDPSIVSMIGNYNNLILQRNRVLKSSSEKNPIIVNIDSQLGVVRNNLVGSLNALRSSAQIQINAISRQGGNISSKIASAPKFEMEYKNIVRDQETKNALYLFLLQKREESILSNAVKVEKAKIVDAAFSSGIKVTPNNMLNYAGALIMGLMIPFLFIYIKNLFDVKVHDEKDIKHLKIPYLGDVPLSASKTKLFIKDGDNTNIAESFRYIRTNLSFMLDSKDTCKTIFITSTQSGEGKTFAAINLASSLAISGKKTLLLAMDLRAPKISNYLDIKHTLPGVTNYIKDKDLTVRDITTLSTPIDNLHFIGSGDVPPNPVELLMSKRVNELFEALSGIYEYIVVDTAPVGLVTDTIQISKYADLTIYLIKADFLDKRMLHIPEKLYIENKLPNMAILINGSDHEKGAYGYGYGYGYGHKKKLPWYKKVFQSAAF